MRISALITSGIRAAIRAARSWTVMRLRQHDVAHDLDLVATERLELGLAALALALAADRGEAARLVVVTLDRGLHVDPAGAAAVVADLLRRGHARLAPGQHRTGAATRASSSSPGRAAAGLRRSVSPGTAGRAGGAAGPRGRTRRRRSAGGGRRRRWPATATVAAGRRRRARRPRARLLGLLQRLGRLALGRFGGALGFLFGAPCGPLPRDGALLRRPT